jgi:hypothetical protein
VSVLVLFYRRPARGTFVLLFIHEQSILYYFLIVHYFFVKSLDKCLRRCYYKKNLTEKRMLNIFSIVVIISVIIGLVVIADGRNVLQLLKA